MALVLFVWLPSGNFSYGQDRAPGAEAKKPSGTLSEEDFAEVYVGRYFPSDEKLNLDAAGARRAEALAHFSRGLSHEGSGRNGKAVAEFRKVLEIIPGEIGLARKVSYLLAQQGKRKEGREVLESAYEAHQGSPRAGITLSEFLATFFGDDDEARKESLKLAETMAEDYPSNPASWEHLVRMYLVARRMEDARGTILKAIERDETDPFFWLRIGKVAQRIWPLDAETQSPETIDDVFEKALELGAKNPAIREQVGDYFHDRSQPERAREIFEALVAEFAERLEYREKLSRIYGALGQEDKVVATLKEILDINPQDAEIHRELGRIYLGRQDFVNASTHYREALRLTAGTAEEYANIGRMIIFDAKLPEEAVTLLERGAYLHPEDSRLPYLITFALPQLDRYDDAVKWFEKTVDLANQSRPEMLDAFFYYRYGASVERAGDIKRASSLFRKSMELIAKLDADDERSRDLRAEVYNYLGYMWLENDMNIDEAGELIKEALSLVPESGAVTDSLGWFYYKKGKYEEAKRELLKAESMVEEPDSVIYDHLGRTYFKLGELDKAVELLAKAVDLDSDNEEFEERLKEFRTAKKKAEEKEAASDAEGDSPESGEEETPVEKSGASVPGAA